MSLVATAHSIPGSLRQDVVVDGRHRLVTDEPERLGGDGSAPAPHELLPAALASCISTSLVMYARTADWELGDVTVEVDYDHRVTPRTFRVSIRVGANVDDAQLTRLERVARACPVRRALQEGAVFEETLVRDTGPGLRVPPARAA